MRGFHEQILTCVEIGKSLASTLNMEQILVTILKRLSELIEASNWTLYLVEPQTRELRFEVVMGLNSDRLDTLRIKYGEGIAGTVALTGECVVIADRVRDDPRFDRRVDELTGFVTRSLICLPLKARDSVIGVLEVVNPEDPSLFAEELRPVLTILADYVAIAITNAQNFKRIEILADTDDVTGFYNSRYLHRHLAELLRPGMVLSLAFLDLDRFKQVVDTHGHLLGSKMLREVAVLFGSRLEVRDSLVRYGGDEYVIVLPGQGKQAAHRKLEVLRRDLAEAVFLAEEGLRIKMTASFGLASFPEDALDPKNLLQAADKAMYASKQRGSNTITLAG